MRSHHFFAGFAGILLFVLAQVSLADPQDIVSTQENVLNFGFIDQQHTGVVNGGVACGPTSVYNSFIYLQNEFHVTGLTQPGDASNTINQLGSYMSFGDNMHAGVAAGGVSEDQLVNGKTQYLRANGFPSNVIAVQSEVNSGGVGPNHVTWEFIFQQLSRGADVEMGWRWTTGGGHVVTLTGMTWDADLNRGTLNFIDPWNDTANGGAQVILNATITGTDAGGFQVSYTGGAAGDNKDPDNQGAAGTGNISVIAAEDPVPLPATLWAGLSLLAGVIIQHCRRGAASRDQLAQL